MEKTDLQNLADWAKGISAEAEAWEADISGHELDLHGWLEQHLASIRQRAERIEELLRRAGIS